MSDLSNSSFIPKRGPVKKRKRTSSRRIYVFTLISYVVLFATLLGVGGVFFYSKHIETNWNKAVAELYESIATFSEADMERVIEFDNRTQQAQDRINNSASVVAIFDVLEEATVETIKFNNLTIDRDGDENFLLSADIETDTFDSAMFQRGVFRRNGSISSSDIEDIALGFVGGDDVEDGEENILPTKKVTSVDAVINIPLSAVPFVPSARLTSLPIIEPVVDTEVEEEVNNQDEL